MLSMLTTSPPGRHRTRLSRTVLRRAHLAVGVVLLAYLYLPADDAEALRGAFRFVTAPAVIATGLLLWKLPAIRRILER